MSANISCWNFLGENFPGGGFDGGILIGENFQGGKFLIALFVPLSNLVSHT